MIRRLTIFALAAVAASAAETTPPAPPPAPDDGIAAAKQDFAEIKASGTSDEQQKLSAPKQELGLNLRERNDRITPPRWMKQPAGPDKPKGPTNQSANWLLDAMNDKDPLSGKDGRKSTERRDEAKDDAAVAGDPHAINQESRQDKDSPSRDENDPAGVRKNAKDAANPLATYMAAWMTPRDYDLLKPGMSDPTAGSARDLLGASGIDGADRLMPDVKGATNASDALATLGDPAAAFAPKQNPYLVDSPPLTPPTVNPATTPAFSAMTVPPTTVPSLLPLPTPAETHAAPKTNPAMDAVQKARDDDKYFKQLKRF